MHISQLIELLFNSDAYIDHPFLFMLTKLRGLYNFGRMVQFSRRTSGKKVAQYKYVSFAIQENLNCSSSSLQSTCLQDK